MKKYQGGCHCGRVRFEIETELTRATECNCSICMKKGALHHRVAPERFRLLSGPASLTLYQSGTKIARHWFCRHCGIHTHSNPRAAPDMVSVNLRCLDDFETEKDNIEIRQFDGRNWEAASKTFKF
ncbi:MAG TPA: GFA family protein [Gallionella sp.]|nr:GFA family protein [Gallionella sp.]